MVARLENGYDVLCEVAAGLAGEIGFDAALAKIQARGEMFPVGHEDRETLRRVYKHIKGIRDTASQSLTGQGFKMNGHTAMISQEVKAESLKAASPRIGTFTVVMGTERRTLRIKKHWQAEEAAKGTLVGYFLSGSDNESDYTGFCFISPKGKVTLWNRFRNAGVGSGNAAIVSAITFLTQQGDYEGAGMTYALESGNCYRCNRLLTVPASINRGLGPECAKKVN